MRIRHVILALAALFAAPGAFAQERAPLGLSGVEVEQSGRGHRAAAVQLGAHNAIVIAQQGQGQTGVVRQNGDNNTAILGQVGRNNSATIAQTGDNNSACVFQFGRNMSTEVSQTGGQTTSYVQGMRGVRAVPLEVCASLGRRVEPGTTSARMLPRSERRRRD